MDDFLNEFTERRLILCEGEQDRAFFRHLIADRSLPPFHIVFPTRPHATIGGRGAFGQMLSALRLVRGFDDLTGIVVVSDNDEDPEAAFRATVEQITSAHGYSAPREPLVVVRNPGSPPLLVMALPWIGRPGTLETLCLEAAYAQHPGIGVCLDRYVDCAGVAAWSLTKRLKMQMRSILTASCRSDPNTSLVYAWSRPEALIPLGHPCFNQVAEFLAGFDEYVAAR